MATLQKHQILLMSILLMINVRYNLLCPFQLHVCASLCSVFQIKAYVFPFCESQVSFYGYSPIIHLLAIYFPTMLLFHLKYRTEYLCLLEAYV
uniref:Uncharacterized protein n=1 Tax=Triticum urartu TaxID=4572 RepID=A0A8R7P6C9_TRIUA